MGILTIPHITRLPTDARSPARLPQKAAKPASAMSSRAEPIINTEEKMLLVFCATRWHISAVR
jgi:hypothetical protein